MSSGEKIIIEDLDHLDSLDKLTDEDLVSLAQKDDREALEILFYRYKEWVRGKARMYYIIGSDEEDIIQEGMMGLFKAIQNYDQGKEAAFGSFAQLCIQSRIVDVLRASRRKKHRLLNESLSLDMPINSGTDKTLADLIRDPAIDLEEDLILSDEMNCIKRGCRELFSSLELLIWDQYLEGKTRHEIAMNTSRSVKSIDNGLQRMKKKIIKYLDGKG